MRAVWRAAGFSGNDGSEDLARIIEHASESLLVLSFEREPIVLRSEILGFSTPGMSVWIAIRNCKEHDPKRTRPSREREPRKTTSEVGQPLFVFALGVLLQTVDRGSFHPYTATAA